MAACKFSQPSICDLTMSLQCIGTNEQITESIFPENVTRMLGYTPQGFPSSLGAGIQSKLHVKSEQGALGRRTSSKRFLQTCKPSAYLRMIHVARDGIPSQ